MFNNLSRDVSLKIHYILDQLIPPVMRDCRWMMALPIRLVFGHHYKAYLDFKKDAYAMSEQEFRDFYHNIADTAITRETDLNKASVDEILANLSGSKILDAGCGHGFLASVLGEKYEVSAVDIVIPDELRKKYPHVRFQEANVEALPFPDNAFDTVISTHTLEHVRNIHLAISELRRVARKRIIVVPRQRPYKYTFDLHLNFFPYTYSLQSIIGKPGGASIVKDVDGDIFYMEND